VEAYFGHIPIAESHQAPLKERKCPNLGHGWIFSCFEKSHWSRFNCNPVLGNTENAIRGKFGGVDYHNSFA